MKPVILVFLAGICSAFVPATRTPFLASLSPALTMLDESDVNITFSSNLTCAACIRGGYLYCNNTNSADPPKCCEPTDLGCIVDILTFKCMNHNWKDRFNSLFTFCGSIQSSITCGNNTIVLDAMGNLTQINIQALGYGESCTYGLISKCGYPKVIVNQSDVDVVVASLNDSSLWRFDDPGFSFKKALTQTLKATSG